MRAQPNLYPKPSLSSDPRLMRPLTAPVFGASAGSGPLDPTSHDEHRFDEFSSDARRPAPISASSKPAPIWLQRISLFVLVMFCIYLGALVTILPWWPRVWEQNPLMLAYPWLAAVLNNGMVRGVISGIGLLDIWIGISEAIHYRDYRG
ncbi:MAG: hypothetical protein ACYCSN_11040 [Acidobacteriaceae bacterium]